MDLGGEGMNFKRIKNIFFGFKGTAIHCPNCKSMNVTFSNSIFDKDGVESYAVRCRDCGSKGVILEKWECSNG